MPNKATTQNLQALLDSSVGDSVQLKKDLAAFCSLDIRQIYNYYNKPSMIPNGENCSKIIVFLNEKKHPKAEKIGIDDFINLPNVAKKTSVSEDLGLK